MQTAHEFVVEPHRIKAGKDRTWRSDLVSKNTQELGLGDTVGVCSLGRDSRDHNSIGVGQDVFRHTDQDVEWLADRVQFQVGPAAGELHDAGIKGADPTGFQVIKEKTG